MGKRGGTGKIRGNSASVYNDFIEEAKAVLTVPRKEKLRHLLEFRFRRHSRYNLPAKRLTMIEKQVRKRAAMLLE